MLISVVGVGVHWLNLTMRLLHVQCMVKFYFFFIFLQIGNSGGDVKFFIVNCLPSRISCMLTFLLLIFYPTDCNTELVTVIPSFDTFNLSLESTAFPVIKVLRVRTDLAT